MSNIILSGKAEPRKTAVVIASQHTNLNDYDLSASEKEYILDSIAKKNYTVTINKFGFWYVFQFVEEKKTPEAEFEALRHSAFLIHKLLAKHKINDIQIVDDCKDAQQTLAFTEGLVLSNYQFLKYFRNREERTFSFNKIVLISSRIEKYQTDELSALSKAVFVARDLINEPASFLTSTVLAEEFVKLGKESGFTVDVFNKSRIEDLKMGGLLAVNKGSIEPPTFTVMTWKPEGAVNEKPYILIGKGVVYDSGGLSLKPTPDSMDYMKCDMAGAAAVGGTMYALAKNNIPVYAIALVPSTDNRLDAHSYSPGDVITMYNGTTVEVMNTDAEGRLILADALAYANQYNPELVITVATLTGSAHRAIGDQGMAGMGNAEEPVFNKLEKTGWKVYERIARLPFWDEYADMIKSDIADLKNIGGDVAGAITAGKFLEHFTNYPFIHLDIAGVAFLKKGNSYKGRGATGVGIRLLYHFLKQVINK